MLHHRPNSPRERGPVTRPRPRDRSLRTLATIPRRTSIIIARGALVISFVAWGLSMPLGRDVSSTDAIHFTVLAIAFAAVLALTAPVLTHKLPARGSAKNAQQMPAAQSPTLTAALLDRDPTIAYGTPARDLIRDQVVLISGAGGSIGSELARQVHSLRPRRLYLLDHDESALHSLQLDLHGQGLFEDETVVLCDIRDERAVHDALAACRPDIVFHAAAHKHLPLLERYPAEGVKTNIFGTLNLVRAAAAVGVERFVNISTDKAAQPTSVLGATKRLAELLVTAHAGGDMRVASVRFGNVLGSRGSFLHSLTSQIERGQLVTVTDPEVTRYFMTIPEAAGLVIEAAVMARSGETYVLDMGAPVKIVSLVEKYVELTGADYRGITYTGLRPGEKLHEALFDCSEIRQVTPHAKISSVAQWHDSAMTVLTALPELTAALSVETPSQLRTRLHDLVPDETRRTPIADLPTAVDAGEGMTTAVAV